MWRFFGSNIVEATCERGNNADNRGLAKAFSAKGSLDTCLEFSVQSLTQKKENEEVVQGHR